MSLTDAVFQKMLADGSKRMDGDVYWQPDPDDSPNWKFPVPIRSDKGWPLFVRASFNPAIMHSNRA